MTAAVSAAWLGARRPLVSATVGDLEWWTVLGGPDAAWPSRIRIWEDDARVVAWGWHNPPGGLEWFVSDDVRGGEEAVVRDEILAWHEHVSRSTVASAGMPRSTADPPGDVAVLDVWAADGWSEATHLAARGWTPTDAVLTQYHQSLDLEGGADAPPPRLPEGYTLRSMRGASDIPSRVAVHRAAFDPSRMSEEKYELLLRQPHYAFDRDVVIEAPDGTFAAFAIAWADPVAKVGELEPVGTHPDHQRRGLGRVVTTDALRRLRAAGYRDAIVFSLRSNQASEALYRSVGFREIALHRRWTRPLG
jgi:ribosomal protein S18 acetylase RimI-like enzyme